MLRKSRYRKRQCVCGAWVTTNALGRASHDRACPGSPLQRAKDEAERRRLASREAGKE